jgi:hypothetical protein
MHDTLDHAGLYLSLGCAVLPLHFPIDRQGVLQCSCGKVCRQPAKHPFARLVKNGLKGASRDVATVARWFGAKRVNIGIATGAVSGIIALDIDPRHEGDETLLALERKHSALPATWRFLTGGGGEHMLFRHPGRDVPNSAGALGPGIDVRGDGGYIVAPPSRHISGRSYAISVDHHPDKARKTVEWRTLCREGAAEGERNVTIARLSGLLLGRRIEPHVCLELVLIFNATRCRPPLPEEEVARTVASIARREYAGLAKRRDRGRAHG